MWLLTSSTTPDERSFQQKWINESSDWWMYNKPFLLSGYTILPLMDIFPALNSTRFLDWFLPAVFPKSAVAPDIVEVQTHVYFKKKSEKCMYVVTEKQIQLQFQKTTIGYPTNQKNKNNVKAYSYWMLR